MLVGHSMGSDVIVEAAKRLPRQASRAWSGWMNTKSLGDAVQPRNRWTPSSAKFRKDFRGTTKGFVRGMFAPNADPKLVDRVAKDMASAPPAVGLSALRNTLLNGANIPAALAGSNYRWWPSMPIAIPRITNRWRKHGVKAFVMPDSGHFPMLEDPPRFNRSLDSVIKGFAK